MPMDVDRSGMAEVDALRVPAVAGQGGAQAEQDAQHELGRLARTGRRWSEQFLANGRGLAGFDQGQRERATHQVPAVDQCLKHGAQARQVGQQEAERSEIGQPPGLRHPQAEVGESADLGGLLQQLQRGSQRDALLRVDQHPARQRRPAHQRLRVQARGFGDFEIVGQRRGASVPVGMGGGGIHLCLMYVKPVSCPVYGCREMKNLCRQMTNHMGVPCLNFRVRSLRIRPGQETT